MPNATPTPAPAMTRKHYVYLARIIHAAGRDVDGRRYLARIFADYLARTSATFDPARFLQACLWGATE